MESFLKDCPDKSSKTASRIISGEAVVVIPEKGMVNILNKVASRIWELLDGKKGLGDIALIISKEFEVNYEAACQDVEEFIGELSKKGMIAFDFCESTLNSNKR